MKNSKRIFTQQNKSDFNVFFKYNVYKGGWPIHTYKPSNYFPSPNRKTKKKNLIFFFEFQGEIRPRTLNGPLGLNFYIEIYS